MSPMFRVDVCGRLRADIRSIAAPAEPDLEPGKDFYPQNRVLDLLTPERTLEVLDCQCGNCRIRCEYLSWGNPVIRDTIVATANPAKPRAVLLFALLTLIECPQLIRAFLQRSGSDEIFNQPLKPLTDDRVRSQYWPAFDKKEPQTSKNLARAFGQHKYQFATPILHDRGYANYEQRTILPFCKELLLGAVTDTGEIIPEGSSGRVYSFEIVEGYRNFEAEHAAGVRRFARKEFHTPIVSRIDDEINNLERVKTLKDPNIVKIITAYKHGDRFNIIFPCARTNLGQYIRDQHYGAGDSYAGTVEMHPFWREMLGVARALNRIINNVSDATGKNSMYGYHFDLKPANVLIEDVPEGANFLISDFGQATFKNVDGDSKISGVGGTEAYAPPEVDQGHIKRNRKYDIWSLGCILLEVCAFVVEGYAGVKQFDEVRQSMSPSTGCRDDYYWHRLPGPRYELKPQIVLWMNSLSNSNSVCNPRTHHFIKDIMALLRKMLEVNMELRLASETVYAKLSLLLDQYQSPPTPFSRRLSDDSDDSDDSDELAIGEDLVELGKERLAQIHQINCLSAGRWYGGAAKLVEDWSNVLTLLTFLQEANPPLELGSRTELRLLPYSETSLSVGNLSSSGTNTLLILRAPQGSPQMPEITKIFFSNTKDAIAMQSVFLGQDIKPLGQRPDRSLSLYSAAIEKRPAKLRSILPRPKLASAIETLGPASFVQLWSEQSYRDPLKALSRPKRDSPRAKEEFLLCAAPRRIVIFFQTALLIVPIARNARVEKSKDTASKALKIVPTDKKADPSFAACLLHPTSKLQGRYALPLHRGQLEEEEYKGSFECKALEIVFQSEGDLIVFSKAYLALKKEWKDEDDQIKRSRRQMGPELGWGAD